MRTVKESELLDKKIRVDAAAAERKQDHELQLQQVKAQNEEQRKLVQQEINLARTQEMNEVPRHKKYQSIVKFY